MFLINSERCNIDPYLVFYRMSSTGSKTEVHRTEVIKNNLNPEWKPFTLPVKDLTAGDVHNAMILIECYDEDMASDDIIGKFEVRKFNLLQLGLIYDSFVDNLP